MSSRGTATSPDGEREVGQFAGDLPVLHPVRDRTQREHLDRDYARFACGAVGHHTRQRCDPSDPAAVVLTLDFDVKLHASRIHDSAGYNSLLTSSLGQRGQNGLVARPPRLCLGSRLA